MKGDGVQPSSVKPNILMFFPKKKGGRGGEEREGKETVSMVPCTTWYRVYNLDTEKAEEITNLRPTWDSERGLANNVSINFLFSPVWLHYGYSFLCQCTHPWRC